LRRGYRRARLPEVARKRSVSSEVFDQGIIAGKGSSQTGPGPLRGASWRARVDLMTWPLGRMGGLPWPGAGLRVCVSCLRTVGSTGRRSGSCR
jgi:hypothetical protein